LKFIGASFIVSSDDKVLYPFPSFSFCYKIRYTPKQSQEAQKIKFNELQDIFCLDLIRIVSKRCQWSQNKCELNQQKYQYLPLEMRKFVARACSLNLFHRRWPMQRQAQAVHQVQVHVEVHDKRILIYTDLSCDHLYAF
jgi:hypothetical protein